MSAQGASLFRKKKKKGRLFWWKPRVGSDLSTEKDGIKQFRRWCAEVGIELHPNVGTGLVWPCLQCFCRSPFEVKVRVMGWV